MSWHNKVIWTEGMFLRPSHFQQQERHLLHWLESRASNLQCYSWGLTRLEIDQQLLGLGKFAVTACQGIFPDGTPFSVPDHNPSPLAIDIPEDCKNQTVYLSLPIKRINGQEIDWNGQNAEICRYKLSELETKDVHSESTPEYAIIQSAELWTQFRLSGQHQDAFVTIPIARIAERKTDKTVILDNQYIPTCLHVGASTQLSGYLQEAEGLLQHRGNALAKRLGAPGAGGVAEIVDFLHLQIINRYLLLVHHFSNLSQLHPESLYGFLLQIVGELATMTEADHLPKPLPDYQHEDLTATFEPVMIAFRKALSWETDTRAIPIPLEEHKNQVRTALIHDHRLFDAAEFVLAANAQMAADQLRLQLPRQTTIATVEKLRDLVMSQVPGVRLTALAVAPRQIPFHKGMTYFTLDKHHALWQELEKSGTIAMHFSGEYPGLELELWAIKG